MCNICDITRSKRSLIINHIMRHHSKDARCSQFAVIGRDQRRYVCQVCGVARSKLSLLRKHLSLFHWSDEELDEDSSTTDVSRKRRHTHDGDCRMASSDAPSSDCNGSTSSHICLFYVVFMDAELIFLTALKEHHRSYHKKVCCNICGASCLRRSLKRHLHIHEIEVVEKRLYCTAKGCLQSYSNNSNLKKHYEVVHLGARAYQCTVKGCGRTFGYRHVRDKHEKTSEHCYGQGDFYEEDLKFQSHPRGGRKPFILKTVEDLFRKKVVSCKQWVPSSEEQQMDKH